MTAMFDTLTFTKQLIAAGEKPEVAEAIAGALKEAMSEGLATKSDMKDLAATTKSDMKDLEHKIDDLAATTKSDMKDLEHKIDDLDKSLTIKMGGFLIIAVGAIATLSKIL